MTLSGTSTSIISPVSTTFHGRICVEMEAVSYETRDRVVDAGRSVAYRGFRFSPRQPTDHADRPSDRLSPRDAAGTEHEQQGEPGHPCLFRWRHASGGVFLWRAGVPQAYRDHGAERTE